MLVKSGVGEFPRVVSWIGKDRPNGSRDSGPEAYLANRFCLGLLRRGIPMQFRCRNPDTNLGQRINVLRPKQAGD